LFPHSHLRGKGFEYRVVWPGGRTESIPKVPKYRFNWQLSCKLENPLDAAMTRRQFRTPPRRGAAQ
jgi:hypothetical protein